MLQSLARLCTPVAPPTSGLLCCASTSGISTHLKCTHSSAAAGELMVSCSCLQHSAVSAQVNVCELLADLLESSEVDCLDNEDPLRMRTSAQAKLADITEVHILDYLCIETTLLGW